MIPALGKFLVIAVVEAVILTAPILPSFNLLEAATSSQHFVFNDIDKSGRCLIGNAFSETFSVQIFTCLGPPAFFGLLG